MFTGLVETMGTVESLVAEGPAVRLTLAAGSAAGNAVVGDSIAINGCCLTVVGIDAQLLTFEAGRETLARTNLGKLTAGSRVNLERSLRVGDRMGGHFVTGHIDGLGHLANREDEDQWSTFRFEVSLQLSRQMASKGSVAVDGVSLTLVDVTDISFSVALIPHTLQVTTLGALVAGDPVNLETDVLAKYVQRQLASQDGTMRDNGTQG